MKVAEGAGLPDYKMPNGGDVPDFPNGSPDPDGPPGPPNPPGLPSLRGSQRDSAIDIESTTAFTAEEPARISRREADKVYIQPMAETSKFGSLAILSLSKVYVLLPMMAIEPLGKHGCNRHSDRIPTSML